MHLEDRRACPIRTQARTARAPKIATPDLLVVGTSIDPHIRRVLELLPESVDIVRLDVDQYPKSSTVSVDQSGRATRIVIDSRTIVDGPVSVPVVWFRRLGAPGLSSAVEKRFRRFAVAEANHVLESALTLANPHTWVNEYWACRRAALKPLQYQIAAQVGFRVADTAITNLPAAARQWLAGQRRAISKTLSSPVIFDDADERGFSFTHVLDEDDRDELEAVAVTPTQFQTLIDPAFELRVTSVGATHFAVRIDTDASSSRGVRDWRSERLATSYSWFELPREVGAKLTALLESLRLDYAATDFIISTEGDYFFLESNPHGAWAWLEDVLGDSRISESFADHLLTSIAKHA